MTASKRPFVPAIRRAAEAPSPVAIAAAGFVSTARAAALLGRTVRTIERLCAKGQIPGHRLQGGRGDWRIPKVWIDAELARIAALVEAAKDE